MKKIIVTIAKDGGTKIEASGFSDNTCLAETKSLEEALGVAGSRTKKPEAHVSAGAGTVKAGAR
jgi:hypothetical protein